MPIRTCWNCEARANQTLESAIWAQVDESTVASGLYCCDNCGAPALGVGPNFRMGDGSAAASLANTPVDMIDWSPRQGESRTFPDVPDHIAEAASEAYSSLSIGARRGAVMLARSVIEAGAKHRGVTDGNLFTKITTMHEDRMVRDHIADAAHEVRHLGNDMAHGDFIEPVTTEEAEEVLGLMSEVLDDLFQSPARVARRKAAREAKEAGS